MKSKSAIDEIAHTLANYFTFSRMHRRGAMVLLGIMLLLCAGFYFIEFLRPEDPFDPAPFAKEIALFEKSLKQVPKQGEEVKFTPVTSFADTVISPEPVLFSFDPNTLYESEFMKLGLTGKQAKVILNYRSKGGRFKNSLDFKKMYCISEKEFNRLEPYISITPVAADEYKSNSTPPATVPKTPLQVYDINTAGPAEFDSIAGIGPAIANRIIQYRDRLGGYISMEQLKEVFGIDSMLFGKISHQLQLTPSTVNRININAGFEDDMKHPYLNRNLVRLIVNYRRLHGPFRSVEDLRKLALVNEELYSKLAPYLTTE